MCGNYTSYLKTVTSDVHKPFLVDLNPIFKDGHLLVYATLSFNHYRHPREEYHNNFVVQYEGHIYDNQNKTISFIINRGFIQLFFDIPVRSTFSAGDSITLSIFNLNQKRAYKHIQSCVSVPQTNPLPLVTCSYISDHNTIPELLSWIAFQRVVNVSKVVFFQATPIPGFNEAFGHLIKEGYVEVFDFTWPRDVARKIIQESNQEAQINACFYRQKYRASAVVVCDVDEYVYSEKYPFDLPELVRFTRRSYPQYELLKVSINSKFHM